MNRTLTFVLALFMGFALSGQYEKEKTEVPLNLKQLTLDQKSWITTNGFPLSNYDFSNPDINLHLSTALDQNKKGEILSTIGYVVIGIGGVMMLAPLIDNDIELSYATSAIVSMGGLAINLTGYSKKKKAKKHVQNASYIYNDR